MLTQDSHGAKSALRSTESAVRLAQVEVTKLMPLVERNIVGHVRLEAAEAQLAQAQSDRAQAEAQYHSVLANIDYAIIRSPIDGVVGTLPFKIGSLVGPTDANPLTTISDVSRVYANFSMNEKEYFNFLMTNTTGETLNQKLGDFPTIGLLLADGSTYPEKGVLATIAGIVDVATGTVQFKAIFPNKNGLLNNGNSGVVTIPKVYKDVLVVPTSATFEQQGKVYVYKIDDDDLTKSTIVEVLDRVDNMLLVANGIEKGDKIVAEGVGFIRGETAVSPNIIPFDSLVNSLKPVFK